MTESISRNGRPASFALGGDPGPQLGTGERLERGLRHWEPDPGPQVGIGLACRPRPWRPDADRGLRSLGTGWGQEDIGVIIPSTYPGAGLGGFNIGHFFSGVVRDVGNVVKGVIHPFESVYNAAVPILAKASTALATAAPFLATVPIVGPALTAGAVALAAAGPALEKLREQGLSPAALAGVAQAALAAAPGGLGASVKQIVAQAPGLADAASALGQVASAAKPTVEQIQQGQQLLQQTTQSTPALQAIAQKFAPHVLSPDVAKTTVPAAQAKHVALHLNKAAQAAGYGPYPQPTATAPSGTTAGVGYLDRGGGRGGGGHRAFRRRSWTSGGRWGWGGPWWPYAVVGDAACASWGEAINYPAELHAGLLATLRASRGPVTVRGADGVLYLLALEAGAPTGGGLAQLVTVRPCLAVGVGGADDDVLRAMALDLLAELRRTGAPQYATRAVKSFAQAWNTAQPDQPIDASGKYVRETQGALDAALAALAPGSGAAPAAVL